MSKEVKIVDEFEFSKEVKEKLQSRFAEKNQDKILEAMEKIHYHQGMIAGLKTEVEQLTKII